MDAHEDVSGRSPQPQIEDQRSSRSRPRQNSIQVPAQIQVPATGKFPNRPPAKISTPTHSHEDEVLSIFHIEFECVVDGRPWPPAAAAVRDDERIEYERCKANR